MNEALMTIGSLCVTPFSVAVCAAAVIGCAPIRGIADRIRKIGGNGTLSLTGKARAIEVGLYIGAVLLLAWCMLRLSSNGYNPFIYFKF